MVTGCVATSMAQIMYYYQHPAATTEAIPGYTTRTLGTVMPELDATTFDWESMLLNYSGTTTDDAQTAVATLMLYCGFRAWFEDAQISSLNMPALTIATQPANGIGTMLPVRNKTEVYDLQGRRMDTSDPRLLPKGVYIVGGRKFMIP